MDVAGLDQSALGYGYQRVFGVFDGSTAWPQFLIELRSFVFTSSFYLLWDG